MIGDLLRRLLPFLNTKPDPVVPEPRVSRTEAAIVAKELALLNQIHWDDASFSIGLSSKEFSRPCWKIFTGIEAFGSGDDWSSTGQIDSANYLFIDAETGELAGIGNLRSVVPALSISRGTFKFPVK